jgi:hypothetical protein
LFLLGLFRVIVGKRLLGLRIINKQGAKPGLAAW